LDMSYNTSPVGLTIEDIDFMRRGLLSLQTEVSIWMRCKRWFPFPRRNPHYFKGGRVMIKLNRLIEKLDSVRDTAEKYKIDVVQPTKPSNQQRAYGWTDQSR